MSGDPDQEYFSDGIAEDIITALSRFHSLFVIARNSSFTYKGRAVDVKQVSAELGVRYVLEGSVRKAGARVRITAQLVEGATRSYLWAEHYDRELDDIFAVQDEITETIVAAIEPEVSSTERKRVLRKPPEHLDAWECYQRGMWHHYQYTRDGSAEARRFFKRAADLDPSFGSAYAALAINDVLAYNTGYIESLDTPAAMLRVAQKAVALDERDPLAYRALGWAYAHLGQHEDGIAALRTAVDLNPSYADGYEDLGQSLGKAARYEEAIEQLETSIRMGPLSPNLWIAMNGIAGSLVLLERYEEGVEWARRAIRAFDTRQSSPTSGAATGDVQSPNYFTYAHLASALGHLGRNEEAKVALDEMLRPQA